MPIWTRSGIDYADQWVRRTSTTGLGCDSAEIPLSDIGRFSDDAQPLAWDIGDPRSWPRPILRGCDGRTGDSSQAYTRQGRGKPRPYKGRQALAERYRASFEIDLD